MEIVLVIGALSFGGAERVISNLANNFAEKGDQVTVVAISHSKVCYPLSEKVNLINGISRKSEFDAILKLRKIFTSLKPQVILSFLTHINIAAIIAAFGTGYPVVVSERNDPKKSPPEISRKIMRALFYPFAKGLVFQTDKAQQYFPGFIRKKSVIIANPLYLQAQPSNTKDRVKEIVSVGRLVPQKNHDKIIKAFSVIAEKFPEYRLNIYGEGNQRNNLINLIIDLNLEERITLHGERSDLHEKISNSEIFILASDYEGMPNALMEAMALGLACISTNSPSGGSAFLINHNENGLLIPVGNIEELIKSLEMLLLNNSLRKRMGAEAMKISKNVDPNLIYDQWRSYLQTRVK